MDFSEALVQLKTGKRVARDGWNGKGMFLFIVSLWDTDAEEAAGLLRRPFVAMKTAQEDVVPWLASQSDLLAGDWEIV